MVSVFFFFILIILLQIILRQDAAQKNVWPHIPGAIDAQEPSPSCPHGHRIHGGELLEFEGILPPEFGGPEQNEFQIRIGSCASCGVHAMRAGRRTPHSRHFSECRTPLPLRCAPPHVIQQLKESVNAASRYKEMRKRLRNR